MLFDGEKVLHVIKSSLHLYIVEEGIGCALIVSAKGNYADM